MRPVVPLGRALPVFCTTKWALPRWAKHRPKDTRRARAVPDGRFKHGRYSQAVRHEERRLRAQFRSLRAILRQSVPLSQIEVASRLTLFLSDSS